MWVTGGLKQLFHVSDELLHPARLVLYYHSGQKGERGGNTENGSPTASSCTSQGPSGPPPLQTHRQCSREVGAEAEGELTRERGLCTLPPTEPPGRVLWEVLGQGLVLSSLVVTGLCSHTRTPSSARPSSTLALLSVPCSPFPLQIPAKPLYVLFPEQLQAPVQ